MVFEAVIQQIAQLIAEHGVLAVMAGMVIEEVFVPIPSPAIPMAAGASSIITASTLVPALTQIFFYIAIPASFASVVSSYFVYGIAYKGGEPMIRKYGKYLDISWSEVQQFERHFDHDHERYYVALFRAIPIIPLSLISGSAGLFQMNWKEYGIWSFIGMLPRNFVLAYVGWAVKDDFMAVASHIDSVSTAVALAVAASVGGIIIYRKSKDVYKYLLRRL